MMRTPLSLCALCLALCAGAAGAAEPTSSRSPAAVPVAGQAPAISVVKLPPLTEEQKALLEIQEQGRQEVERLVASMKDLDDGPALRALQLKVQEAKKDNRVRFLRALAGFARVRGDLRATAEAEDQIERILNPRPTPAGPTRESRERSLEAKGGRP